MVQQSIQPKADDQNITVSLRYQTGTATNTIAEHFIKLIVGSGQGFVYISNNSDLKLLFILINVEFCGEIILLPEDIVPVMPVMFSHCTGR